ncbi:MAG: CHAT domain-containing protein [Candidatus Velthaea sp.]
MIRAAIALSLVCLLCVTHVETATFAAPLGGVFQAKLDKVREAYAKHDRQKALRIATAGLAAARRADAKLWIAAFAQTSGVVASDLGMVREAVALETEAAMLFGVLGERRNEAQALNSLGVAYAALGRTANAIAAYRKAISLYRILHDDGDVGVESNNVGLALIDLGRYREASEIFAASLASFRSVHNERGEAAARENAGVVRLHLGEYRKALSDFRGAFDIQHRLRDQFAEAGSLTDIGATQRSLGAYAEALRSFNEALALARSSGNRLTEANALGELGTLQATVGQSDDARTNENESLAISRAVGDPRGEALTLTNLGVLAREVGSYDEARAMFDASIAIDRRIGEPQGLADNVANLATLARVRGDYVVAVTQARDAAKRYHAIGDATGEAAALVGAGIDESKRGNWSSARDLIELGLRLDRLHENRLAASIDLANLSRISLASGRIGEALRWAREGYAIGLSIGAPTWGVLPALADVEARLGHRAEAIAHYEAALNGIEAQRRELTRLDVRRSFQASVLSIYDRYVRYLLSLHQRDRNAGYDRRALEVFEREQARAFLDQIGQSNVRRFADVPERVTIEDASVTLALADVDDRIASLSTTSPAWHSQLVELEAARHALRARRNALDKQIGVAYPAYYRVTRPGPIDVANLQRLLAPHQAMLIFDVLDDQTALWIVRSDRTIVHILQFGSAEFAAKVASFRREPLRMQAALDQGASSFELSKIADTAAFAADSFAMYEALLPPAARAAIVQADSLIIVPTGPLYDLPWSALVTEQPSVGVSPHYLIEDRSVSYLSSGSLLGALREARAGRSRLPRNPVLAFANPDFTSRATIQKTASAADIDRSMASYVAKSRGKAEFDTFPALPASETEARSVVAALHAPAASHPLLIGADASLANVRRLSDASCVSSACLSDYRYILFATHAVLPDDVRGLMQPALVLSHPSVDGYLTMGEVFGLRLNAEVVSLSACNTGRGIAARGDGVRGLTQAFMFAGTAAVSVTLWEVEDRAALQFTPTFYASMAQGESPARALRAAQLGLLRGNDPLLRNPFFWAPTVLFGEGGR